MGISNALFSEIMGVIYVVEATFDKN